MQYDHEYIQRLIQDANNLVSNGNLDDKTLSTLNECLEAIERNKAAQESMLKKAQAAT